jgi:hypothetical protein
LPAEPITVLPRHVRGGRACRAEAFSHKARVSVLHACGYSELFVRATAEANRPEASVIIGGTGAPSRPMMEGMTGSSLDENQMSKAAELDSNDHRL